MKSNEIESTKTDVENLLEEELSEVVGGIDEKATSACGNCCKLLLGGGASADATE